MSIITWEDIHHGNNRGFKHHAHRSDYLRLRILNMYGGIYADFDMMMIRPIPDYYFEQQFVIAKQESTPWFWRSKSEYYGLCNAFMMSVQNSTFTQYLVDTYSTFRSYGHDEFWDEHSVRVPAHAVDTCSEWTATGKVHVAPSTPFFKFLWGDNTIYQKVDNMNTMNDLRTMFHESIFIHQWSSKHKSRDTESHEDMCQKNKKHALGGCCLLCVAILLLMSSLFFRQVHNVLRYEY